MTHTEDLNDISVTVVTTATTSNATDEGKKEERLTFPQFTNAVVVYGFPSILVVGLVSNLLSFVTILDSSIRETSTGLYLCVLAAVDSVTLYVWTSAVWGVPVLGRAFPPLHICRIRMFLFPMFMSWSPLCIVCVTTDRFLAVWFPFKAKTLTTRRRAGFVLLSVTCALLALFLPILFGYGPNCEVLPKLSLYTTSVSYLMNNVINYGTAVYLFCINIAISIKLMLPSTILQEATMSTERESQNFKIAVTVLLVSVAFLICSVPIAVLASAKAARMLTFPNALTEEIVFTVCRFLSLLNYSVNFFLYIFSSSTFRHSLLNLFSGRCRNQGPSHNNHGTVSSNLSANQA